MSLAVVLLVLLLFLCSAAVQQITSSFITLNSSLTPSSDPSWFSSSKTFAFGFYTTPTGYAICIFFTGFFDRSRAVVWTANADSNPIIPFNDAVLKLTRDGMILQRSETQETFSRIDNSSRPIAGASMRDNGNFVLFDSHGRITWQSFDHPTNSLLPGQRLLPGAELLSRASETDLGKGNFRLKMQSDGNLVLYNVDSLDVSQDSYYASGTNGRGSNISLNLDGDGRLYLFDGASVVLNMTMGGGNLAKWNFYLARIDNDGIFRLYSRMLIKRAGWEPAWSVTQDKCLPKGLCGLNSYCDYDYSGNAVCKCIPGYYPASFPFWNLGCISSIVVDCSDKNQSSKFEMKRIANITWEDDYYSVLSGTSEKLCEEACLKDCNCHVALFSNGQCRKQKLPLRYGRSLASVEVVALFRVNSSSYPGSPWPSGDERRHPDSRVTLGVSFGILGLLISSLITIYCTRTRTRFRCCNRDEENEQNIDKFLLKHGSLAPKRYTCREMKEITRCFAEKLGQGGYGVVYKGKLRDGQLVAVKVLKETHDNAEEFINEVASISRTSHVNIVNLLGFCYHRNKRALVYEFMSNKSLDKFIYKRRSDDPNCSLEWKKLYEIAAGVARGLEYLHRGCNTRIVHFDIKPQNILLDEDFSPKISDFGLAKLCGKKQSMISMLGMRGTVGYIAPEVYSRTFGVASHKSDVYSYGIMLLHVVEAKYVGMESSDMSDAYFFDKVYEHVLVQNERVDDLVTEEEEESARRMLMVGFWCIQTSPMDRPSMSEVVEMLEGKLQSVEIPPRPFLLSSPKLKVPSFISCGCKCTNLRKGGLDSLSSPNLKVPALISCDCKCTKLRKGGLDSCTRPHTCLFG